MPNTDLTLSERFADASEADWKAAVEKALRGKPPESLARKTADKISYGPLARETDYPAARDPEGVPGAAPWIRGRHAAPDPFLPWDIRQEERHPDPDTANREIMAGLERGTSSIELHIDDAGQHGVIATTLDGVKTTLEGVLPELATIALGPTTSDGYGLGEAALLAAWAASASGEDKAKKLAFNIDPVSTLARAGALPGGETDAMAKAAAFVRDARDQFPLAKGLRADARPVHEAGGTPVQELAFALASGAAGLQALVEAGLDLHEASDALLLTLSVGPDYLNEIAKLRAMRRLWTSLTKGFGAHDGLPLHMQAVTSRRMLTKRDPHVNMLRNTAACFAGGVGGADVVTVRPFTDAIGLAGSMARRTARNTQIIAQEESFLGKVADPAGGTWAVGELADTLAKHAWSAFQAIESQGGVMAALTSGYIQSEVSEARTDLRRNVATRRTAITGVSEYALLDEMPTTTITPDDKADRGGKRSGSRTPDSMEFADLTNAARRGTGLAALAQDGSGERRLEADPLWPMRLSEPFERLRDAADKRETGNGTRPQVFLATLGPVADHAARAGFAANAFAAGGIGTVDAGPVFSDETEMAEAFAASSARLVCICGSDALYEDMAVKAANALRDAVPSARIYLAGKPGDAEADLRKAGVDDFLYLGVDLVSKLEIAHAELGLG